MQDINLNFRIGYVEYLQAVIFHVFKNFLRGKFNRILFIGLMIYLISCYFYFHSDLFFAILAVILLLLPACIAILAVIICSISYKCEPRFRDIMDLKFTEKGIALKTSYVDSKIKWSLYKRILESKNFFLLYFGEKRFTIIPKRVFVDSQQVDTFRNLINHSILVKK